MKLFYESKEKYILRLDEKKAIENNAFLDELLFEYYYLQFKERLTKDEFKAMVDTKKRILETPIFFPTFKKDGEELNSEEITRMKGSLLRRKWLWWIAFQFDYENQSKKKLKLPIFMFIQEGDPLASSILHSSTDFHDLNNRANGIEIIKFLFRKIAYSLLEKKILEKYSSIDYFYIEDYIIRHLESIMNSKQFSEENALLKFCLEEGVDFSHIMNWLEEKIFIFLPFYYLELRSFIDRLCTIDYYAGLRKSLTTYEILRKGWHNTNGLKIEDSINFPALSLLKDKRDKYKVSGNSKYRYNGNWFSTDISPDQFLISYEWICERVYMIYEKFILNMKNIYIKEKEDGIRDQIIDRTLDGWYKNLIVTEEQIELHKTESNKGHVFLGLDLFYYDFFKDFLKSSIQDICLDPEYFLYRSIWEVLPPANFGCIHSFLKNCQDFTKKSNGISEREKEITNIVFFEMEKIKQEIYRLEYSLKRYEKIEQDKEFVGIRKIDPNRDYTISFLNELRKVNENMFKNSDTDFNSICESIRKKIEEKEEQSKVSNNKKEESLGE